MVKRVHDQSAAEQGRENRLARQPQHPATQYRQTDDAGGLRIQLFSAGFRRLRGLSGRGSFAWGHAAAKVASFAGRRT